MSTISARGSKAASQPASATLSPVVLLRETGYTCSGGGGTTTIIVQFKSQPFLFFSLLHLSDCYKHNYHFNGFRTHY